MPQDHLRHRTHTAVGAGLSGESPLHLWPYSLDIAQVVLPAREGPGPPAYVSCTCFPCTACHQCPKPVLEWPLNSPLHPFSLFKDSLPSGSPHSVRSSESSGTTTLSQLYTTSLETLVALKVSSVPGKGEGPLEAQCGLNFDLNLGCHWDSAKETAKCGRDGDSIEGIASHRAQNGCCPHQAGHK